MPKENSELEPTSITLTQYHKDLLDHNGVNLSKFVRRRIEQEFGEK